VHDVVGDAGGGHELAGLRAVQLSGWYPTISTMWPSGSFDIEVLVPGLPFPTLPLSDTTSTPLIQVGVHEVGISV